MTLLYAVGAVVLVAAGYFVRLMKEFDPPKRSVMPTAQVTAVINLLETHTPPIESLEQLEQSVRKAKERLK
jgi:hypothetical protein